MNQKSAWIVPNLQPTGKFVPKLKKKKKKSVSMKILEICLHSIDSYEFIIEISITFN